MIFSVLTAITVVVRIMQNAAMIDPKTGFYYKEYEVFEPVFLITIFALMIAYFIIAMLSSENPPLGDSYIVSRPLGVMTFMLAVVAGIRCVPYVLKMATISVSDYFLLAAYAAFFIFCVAYGVMLICGKKAPSELFLIPSLFGAVRFTVTFISYVDVIKVTDIILTITMLGVTMMFWHMFARVNAGMASKSTVKMLYGFGFPAALLCFACSVPKYYVNWFMPNTGIHISEHISYFDFASGIYIAVFLVMTLFASPKIREYD